MASVAEPTAGTTARPFSWAALLPLAVAETLYALLLAVRAKFLNDPDSYWHIAVGRWIVDHRALPTIDGFSFTFAGQPWIAKEWLAQIFYLGAFAIGGWNGMALLAAAAVTLTFVLLTRFLQEHLAPLVVIAVLAVTFLLVAPHIVARPHILAWPVMVAWVGILVRAVDKGRKPPFPALLLMVLWANLHGGFTLGILLAAGFGLDATVAAPSGARLRTAIAWSGFVLLTLGAACVTPYGPESILVTYRIFALGPALSVIGEWRPVDFSTIGAFELCVLAAFGLALYRGVRFPIVRILIVVGLLHLALSSQRHVELLALLAPMILAAPLAAGLPGVAGALPTPGRREFLLAGAGALALLSVVTLVLGSDDIVPATKNTPAAALSAARDAGADRLLNDYDFGGYLIYEGVPTFIDGRGELYGGDFITRHSRAVGLANLDDLVRMLDDFRIDATILAPSRPAVAFLDRLPGWHRLYADDVAVVHVRDLRGALDP